MKPGLLNDTFYIQFNENWFDEGSILQTNYTTHVEAGAFKNAFNSTGTSVAIVKLRN